jgi:hypothetical protein
MYFSDLAGQRTNGACSSRNHEGLTGLNLCNVQQTLSLLVNSMLPCRRIEQHTKYAVKPPEAAESDKRFTERPYKVHTRNAQRSQKVNKLGAWRDTGTPVQSVAQLKVLLDSTHWSFWALSSFKIAYSLQPAHMHMQTHNKSTGGRANSPGMQLTMSPGCSLQPSPAFRTVASPAARMTSPICTGGM